MIQPEPTPHPDPNLRHLAEKEYMLNGINRRRADAGLAPVELGKNIAAQLHAEASLANCSGSHWGADGLKPYMRYTLAGGTQSNAENVSGLNYCIKRYDNFTPIESVEALIDKTMGGWMNSPGHRDNIMKPTHRKVNIGLAWNLYNIMLVQHFEGDYVEYNQLPAIVDGVLSLSGEFRNGASPWRKEGYHGVNIQVRYDPPPKELSRGQLANTYCYDYGDTLAFVQPSLPEGMIYQRGVSVSDTECADPYEAEANGGPTSYQEAKAAWEQARFAAQMKPPNVWGKEVPIVEAAMWHVTEEGFDVEARLPGFLMINRNPGVYTVMVWAGVNGNLSAISEYALWVGIDPPDAYRSVK
ncbi:MAG: CAP domain-containing protein [Chloroflexi bacterium]|nr:CAP domain-containing protein [Chloroflexota bacterium]